MYRVSHHIPHFALALAGGIAVACLWVNIDADSYYDLLEYRLLTPPLPDWFGPDAFGVSDPVLTLRTITSEGLMALFIAFIAKELWEALVLERGALSGARRWWMPLGAVMGGVIGAVVVWRVSLLAGLPPVAGIEDIAGFTGWPVPIGSDVVLCYVFGAWVFGRDHPALHLLLLISIAFDILGLIGIGLASLTSALHPLWLIPSVLAIALVRVMTNRLTGPKASEVQRRRALLLWPYAVAGGICWLGFILSGLPGALGLLPLIPVLPHAGRSFGLFAEAEAFLHDPLNRFSQSLVRPLPVILFLFGLTRGGVDASALGPMTLRVLAALWIGKPVGLLLGSGLAMAWQARSLPVAVRLSDLVLIAILTGMGATVPLLAVDFALPGGILADQARAGVAASLLFGLLALALGRVFGSRKPFNLP